MRRRLDQISLRPTLGRQDLCLCAEVIEKNMFDPEELRQEYWDVLSEVGLFWEVVDDQERRLLGLLTHSLALGAR